jgi:TetR/AcrR family tetracycline transcriptional repressor
LALDKERIVAEALALLDESGLDQVTLRRLAQRLSVQAPTLYWHLRSKAELVNALAEAILEELPRQLKPPATDEPWRQWLIGFAQQLRRAILAHPDGARVISAAHMSATMANLTELAMSTLVGHGLPLRQARLTVLVVQRFTIGHVLEEQSPPPEQEAVDNLDESAFAKHHPTIVAGINDYFQQGRTLDDLFRDSVELIVN